LRISGSGGGIIVPGMTDSDLADSGLSALVTTPAKPAQPACEQLGCHIVFGQLKCQFHPRPPPKKRQSQAVGQEQPKPKRKWKASKRKSWMDQCPSGVRSCPWQVNVSGTVTGGIRLNPVCLQHEGHLMDLPSGSVTRLRSTADVTPAMWTVLCQLVALRRVGGECLRQVRSSSHYSQFVMKIWSKHSQSIMKQWSTNSLFVCSGRSLLCPSQR
jgi:hypothetical protein